MSHASEPNPQDPPQHVDAIAARAPYGLDHVGIVVPDLNAAVKFFAAHFGAQVEFRLERFIDESGRAPARLGASSDASFALAMLRIGEANLELLEWWPSGAEATAPHAVGTVHVALAVDNVRESYEQLSRVPGVRALGAPLTFTGPPTDGLTNAFVQTPWGLLIELMGWPEPEIQEPRSE